MSGMFFLGHSVDVATPIIRIAYSVNKVLNKCFVPYKFIFSVNKSAG